MKNHQSYPTGSKSFPRVNEIFVQNTQKTRGINMKKINGKGEEIIFQKGNPPYYHKWRHNEPKQEKGKNLHKLKDKCHRCGIHGHWSRTCCIPKHLTDLY